MEIEATNPLAPSTHSTERPLPATPEAQQIDEFNRVLFGSAAATPETQLVTQLQTEAKKVNSTFFSTRSDPSFITDPEKVLASQKAVAQAVVSVDLTSKIAQYVSQGVNKLTSMQ